MPTRYEKLSFWDKVIRTYRLLGILGGFEYHRPASLRTAIRTYVDICTNDVTRGPKEVFKVLPAGLVW